MNNEKRYFLNYYIMARIEINDMTWGLNTAEPTKIADNQFSILQNMFYNSDYRLQSRAWITQFWTQWGTNPGTSAFSFVNDTTWDSWLLVTEWENLRQYNSNTGLFDIVKTGLTEFESDGVTRTRWSFAVYLNKVYMCNGIDSYAEYDPATTTYIEFATEPKVRQLAFLWDSIYWGGADLTPNTLYFTNAGAANWQNLDANFVVVWGDESGRINGLEELQQQVQVFKDYKIYAVSWDGTSALATDSESGGFSDRCIKRVANSLMNLSERWIDTVRARSGVWSVQAIESKPLSDNVRNIFAQIKNKFRQFSVAEYILSLTNYYVTIDTTNDSTPETTLVYSSLTKWWSQYTYPSINDYVRYIDSDWEIRFLAVSGNSWVVYEMEKGISDLWAPIPVKLRTKKYDFNDPTILKTFQYVDIVWFKSQWDNITCNVYIEWEVVWGADITDDNIVVESTQTIPIWASTIWNKVVWGWEVSITEIDIYPFAVRIPMYSTWMNIEVELESNSENMVWIPEKISLDKENENIELFSYNNII